MLTIADLGILRDVDGRPSDGVRRHDHADVLRLPGDGRHPRRRGRRVRAGGTARRRVELVLSPAWTTDWMTEDGQAQAARLRHRRRRSRRGGRPVSLTLSLRCPQCGSPDTRELSRFGSTACKSLWVCNACREPFDHFKAI